MTFSSYNRGTIEKVKMSNGGTTDVTVVDVLETTINHLTTTYSQVPVPVSAGPQHRQQLLIQADDASQNFVTDNQCSLLRCFYYYCNVSCSL